MELGPYYIFRKPVTRVLVKEVGTFYGEGIFEVNLQIDGAPSGKVLVMSNNLKPVVDLFASDGPVEPDTKPFYIEVIG